jgi:predicted metal-binding protein
MIRKFKRYLCKHEKYLWLINPKTNKEVFICMSCSKVKYEMSNKERLATYNMNKIYTPEQKKEITEIFKSRDINKIKKFIEEY